MSKESEKYTLVKGKVHFTHTQDGMEFKHAEKVIGTTSHVQNIVIDSKEQALEFIQEQLDSTEDRLRQLRTERDKIPLDMDQFDKIGKYLEENPKKVPLKKLQNLNAYFKKYDIRKRLDIEIDLYKKQQKKIEAQFKGVEAL